MSRIRGVFVVVLLVSMAAPAGRAAERTPELPPQWQAQSSVFEQLAAARGTVMDRDEFLRFQMQLLAPEVAAVTAPEFVYPQRSGDLDGDGKNDLVTVEFTAEQPTLIGRSGLTGAQRWTIPGAFVAIPADLDGDGTGELLSLRFERTKVFAENDPVQLDLNHQHVSLLDGNGAPVWNHDVNGTVLRQGDMKSGIASDLHFLYGLRVIGDATLDGKPDVWVATTNFVQVNTGQVLITADVLAGHTIDGATGLEVGRVSTATLDGIPALAPAGDVNGDGLADAYTFGGLLGEGVLAARSAQGAAYWAVSVPSNQAYLSVHEVNGDGKPDAILQAFVDGSVVRTAYSGADGSVLWTRPDIGFTDAAGPIDALPGTDFIRFEQRDDGLALSAFSGATGEAIWGPTLHPAPPGAFTAWCFCTDDLDGNGSWDPLTAAVDFSTFTMTVQATNGSSGVPMWSLDATALGFPSPAGADFSSDGVGDLVTITADGTTMTVQTWRSTDFGPIWTAGAAVAGFPLGYYGDDVANNGLPEVLVGAINFSEEGFIGSAAAIAPFGALWTVP